MSSFFDKVMSLLGVKEEEDYPPEVSDNTNMVAAGAEADESKTEKPVRRGNLISLAGGAKQQTRVIIVEPLEYEEVKTLVDYLKNRSPVIVKLEQLDRDEAKRLVDFMSGATYALDGHMRKLGDVIFFFAPTSVVIEGELDSAIFDEDY